MKLLDLHMIGFGKFHDRSITFQDGFNVIYGKNEAGKSTLHTFIRGMLFGIEKNRGRAAKGDVYNKYEPWEGKGSYEGRLRIEVDGTVYRFERSFQKNRKEFTVINETLGVETEPTKAFLDHILDGLSETAYNNTISISQLKSATDGGMVSELKNYIANLNNSGSMALNITKATGFLKTQRKALEVQMVPEAARTYTALLGEIRNTEREIAAPEFENQLSVYHQMRLEVKNTIEEKQQEKESMLQKIARGQQVMESNAFTDQASITNYLAEGRGLYDCYQQEKRICGKKSNKVLFVLSLVFAVLLILGAGAVTYLYVNPTALGIGGQLPPFLNAVLSGIAILFLISAGVISVRMKRHRKLLENHGQSLSRIFAAHLKDETISQKAIEAFEERMSEFLRLSGSIVKSEAGVAALTEEISGLQEKQNNCSETIEKQQRVQWELEKKLEFLAQQKDKAESLKYVLAENDRLREEITAIDLALETMTNLSTSIRDSFGLYLNKTASTLVGGITGGIYNSMSVDENLNIFLNTKTKLVPIEQVSRGTMDQIYLALRLATALLLQNSTDQMPLIFDDSFALYDDERLQTALVWLSQSYKGQIIIFTCHRRESRIMEANHIPHTVISM